MIYKYENSFLKINSFDSIHRLTWIRTCSKSLLEYCLNARSSKLIETLYSSPISILKINVNILCTDGLPFFFHCFDEIISNDIRKNILSNANLYMKSNKGETFLFHLIYLYIENENKEYVTIFTNIVSNHPLLLAQRNEQEQTIIDYIEFIKSFEIYNKLKVFHDIIYNILIIQLKKDSIIEQFILNHFGYYLLLFFKHKTLLMTKYAFNLLHSIKLNRSLPSLISNMMHAIIDDDFIKLKSSLKIKANIYYAKDSFGRTCVHLAVLYQRYIILE